MRSLLILALFLHPVDASRPPGPARPGGDDSPPGIVRSQSGTARCDSASARRVLFIGTSFTYVRNVPRLVAGVAESLPGPCIETAMIAVGGATLEDHWRGDSAAARIRSGRWTHVVLNDQSSFGESWWLEGQARVGTSGTELAEFAGRFAEVVRASGAVLVLLAHWADIHAPARDQQALDHHFDRVARATGSEVAQAGGAIRRMEADLTIGPYHADGHHLSAAGAYLEALVLYATLTDRSPIGAARRIEGPAVELNRGVVTDSIVALVDLRDADARAIQAIAAAEQARHRRRTAAIPAPAPLSAEFPRIPGGGEPVDLGRIGGRWSGAGRVLPNPAGDPVAIELTLGSQRGPAGGDTLHLRQEGGIHLVGAATVAIEGTEVIVTATVLPREPLRGRSPRPLAVELRGVVRGGAMIGVARITQRFTNPHGSFDAIGRFEIRKSG